MNIVLALSTFSFAVQAAACIVALAISRAPGWRRVRIGAVLAGTAGMYSAFDIVGALYPGNPIAVVSVTSSNLVVAAVHAGAWIWFSFSDAEGRWSSVPRRLRWLVTGHVVVAAAISLSGHAVDTTRMSTVSVDWLGVSFSQPALTPFAAVSAALTLGILFVSFSSQIGQARRGVVGAKWNVFGFLLFVSCAVEEILVASNVVNFIYLAEVGYLGIVVPMVAQFVQRFIGDAHRLQVLTEALEQEVHLATEERDVAREALAAQERFAALGRMAGGVGHEINNPLQILTLSLDELRGSPAFTGDRQFSEMVEDAAYASERIRRIVSGLRTYALPGEPALEQVLPERVVQDAIASARAALGPRPEIRADLGPAPAVLVDRERILQALGHALDNAARAVGGAGGAGRVVVRTRTTAGGDALIEVRDDGAGFPPSVLARLGEPFVTTQAPGAGMGLGIFIIRGVVAAHGGMLELENARGGGATVRILLPPAVRD